MTMITGKQNIKNAAILTMRSALKLETKGLKYSRGSVYAMVKRKFGFKGSKQKVLDQLNEYINEHILPEAPHWCYGICEADEDGNRIVAMIKRGEIGYWRTTFDPDKDLGEQVNAKNKELGVSLQHAAAMQAGSIFGWDCPAAKAESYDDDGEPIPHPSGPILKEDGTPLTTDDLAEDQKRFAPK